MKDLADGSVIINPETVAVNGVLTWNSLNIRQVPDSSAKMKFTFTNLETFGNEIEDRYLL